MNTSTRRRFSAEFKDQAVSLVNAGRPIPELARESAVKIWHQLLGHKATRVGNKKNFDLKLQKLSVIIGKENRKELGFPLQLKDCLEFLRMTLESRKDSLTAEYFFE